MMSQQTRIDQFFPIINSSSRKGKIMLQRNPGIQKKRDVSSITFQNFSENILNSSKKKQVFSIPEANSPKIKKISSPEKIVKIFSPTDKVIHSNEDSPEKSNSIALYGSLSGYQISESNTLPSSENFKKSVSFTPKNPPRSSSTSKLIAYFSPRKLFEESVSFESMVVAIENLNLARQGAIGSNDFDLEKIYASGKCNINYKSVKPDLIDQYDIKDVVFPKEAHVNNLFTIIIEVFSNTINCGYFDGEELDFLFSTLTLSEKAQMLLVRILKRKTSWFRISRIKYPEIDVNLKTHFQELLAKRFIVSNVKAEEVSNLIRLLQVDEIRKLCQRFKVNHRGSKATMITQLLQLSNKHKTWFIGAKTPSSVLKSSIVQALGLCLRLSDNTICLFEKVFTLLIPSQDPSETTSDLFLMLTRVKSGEILFPVTPKERFPIFKNREQLLGFIEARNFLKKLIGATENKNWETVRKIGQQAYEQLFPYVKCKKGSCCLPSHVKNFFPDYIWTKILTKSIDAFKKTPETLEDAVKFLRALINQNNYGNSHLSYWYRSLSLIEMHHRKDLQTSATLILDALSLENLSSVDVLELFERVKKLERRKTGISKETKALIKDVLVNIRQNLPPEFDVVNEIEATMIEGNVTGSKSAWRVDVGENKIYTSVEQIALLHYRKKGYLKGFHCESSLPLSIFAVLFWNEIYNIPVPGAFVSAYQDSPLDLYTCKFFENRKEQLQSKLKFIKSFDKETFGELFSDEFIKYKGFKSLISSNYFKNKQDFKEIVMCLGTTGIVGICERLADNFNLWKSGFPDLFVWNPLTNECKIVEVKGPGDSLSIKQKLWLQYLHGLGIMTEVCVVKANGTRGRQ